MSTITINSHFSELEKTFQLNMCTPGAKQHLEKPRSFYCGFDGTAKSLQIGNLATLIRMGKLARDGHRMIALVGGMTTRIGDPTGRNSERAMLPIEEVEKNLHSIKQQLMEIGSRCAGKQITVVDNYDWLGDMKLSEYLSHAGKHLRVHNILALEALKTRLSGSPDEDQDGKLTVAEMLYCSLQGYDFAYLAKHYNCSVQFSGSDQWGNIMVGRQLGKEAGYRNLHAVTGNLITDKHGKKFGKSDVNPMFLCSEMTSPLTLHQFFYNQPDEEMFKLLAAYTFESSARINEILVEHEEYSEKRIAQQFLADSVVELVHGDAGLRNVELAKTIMFGKDFSKAALSSLEFLRHDPCLSYKIAHHVNIVDVLVQTELATSKTLARRLLSDRAISVNGVRLQDDSMSWRQHIAPRCLNVLKRGKRFVKLVWLDSVTEDI